MLVGVRAMSKRLPEHGVRDVETEARQKAAEVPLLGGTPRLLVVCFTHPGRLRALVRRLQPCGPCIQGRVGFRLNLLQHEPGEAGCIPSYRFQQF